jgi:hypothetical protein
MGAPNAVLHVQIKVTVIAKGVVTVERFVLPDAAGMAAIPS